MTTRTDVKVDFLESPRIIEVQAPSTEITMQDLVDTLRKQEDAFTGLPFEKLTNASGKEDLGGGVLVGITVDLQNAQLSFEPRTDPAQTGTVTTGSGTPVDGPLGPTYNFVDTSANFIAAGIQRGSFVINFTDNSIADVMEVVSATELRTRVLSNGTDNQWDIGDVYHVFNVIQCNATGGNLVAVDDNDIRITSVFPTAFVQVVRTASSSATLQEQADIQYASFNGGVTVDLTSPYSGTVYPIGTPRQPVNNFTDALSIAQARGFPTFFVIGDATISLGLDYSGYTFIGESKNKTLFTIDPSANVQNAEFITASVEGTLDGGNVLYECSLGNINFVDGFVEKCILNDTIVLSGVADAHFLDCYSGVPGTSTPVIDMGGSGSKLAMRNYNGGIKLLNKSGTDPVSIDMNSGQVIIDDTVTAGTIVLRGIGRWSNKSTYIGGADVIDQLIKVDDVEQASFQNQVTIDVVNGVAGTEYPIGTSSYPVNNLADAYSIASTRGLNKIYFVGNLTLTNVADWTDFIIKGQNDRRSILTVNTGVLTDGLEIDDCTITGIIDGSNINIENSTVNDLSIKSGDLHNCGIDGTLTCTGNSTEQIRMVNCFGAGNPITDPPALNLGGDGPIVTMVRYTGLINVSNKSGSAVFGVALHGGTINLASSVTAGPVICAGLGVLNDSSAGATVSNLLVSTDAGIISELNQTTYDGVTFEVAIARLLSMATGRIVESSSGVFDFYEQDNTTIAFTLTKAGSQRTRS